MEEDKKIEIQQQRQAESSYLPHDVGGILGVSLEVLVVVSLVQQGGQPEGQLPSGEGQGEGRWLWSAGHVSLATPPVPPSPGSEAVPDLWLEGRTGQGLLHVAQDGEAVRDAVRLRHPHRLEQGRQPGPGAGGWVDGRINRPSVYKMTKSVIP